MKEQRFNYKELMKHQVNPNIIIKEKNKPNFDRMADAFYKLLRK